MVNGQNGVTGVTVQSHVVTGQNLVKELVLIQRHLVAEKAAAVGQ